MPLPTPSRDSLASSGLRIRRLVEADADPLYDAVRASLDELIPWMPWCHADYAHDESASWLELQVAAWDAGTEFSFAIEDALGGPLLGTVGLNRIDVHYATANLGYWVRTDATCRGIGTTAARLAAEFGLVDLGLNRLEILASVENVGSLAVARKCGATREGVLRKRLPLHGRAHDAAVFSIVQGDRIPGLPTTRYGRATVASAISNGSPGS